MMFQQNDFVDQQCHLIIIVVIEMKKNYYEDEYENYEVVLIF